ncbi:putative MFS-type transporter C19orf28 [Penaeus vannamei]|uniref:Putative MFS-type transporter C19orf28 n=1 Tax=Penaeus vannamei TaxID=6689 RepID=A0A3R7MHW1_PENVA|nr:putative MFS-type transporter C19orf28 [Penaeus vannamei]
MKKPEERDSADMLIVRAESYTAPANRGMGASSRIRCRGLNHKSTHKPLGAESKMAGLTFRTRFGYGVGHVLNDLCSAMWFTYLLIYFHHVLLFNNSLAGVVLLIGQVADALSTPFVGKEADRTDDLAFCARYGRRKSWHLAGTICVLCAFPFIFLGCLGCSGASDWAQVVYYAPFVVIFQFGWASTQISHLALIPNITQDPNDRTELNAIRYAFTVASNITVYLVTWLVLGLESQDPEAGIGPRDINKFRYIVFIVLAIGCLFVTLFHVMVKEDNLPDYATWQRVAINNAEASEPSQAEGTNVASSSACVPVHCRMTATDWLKDRQFYQVAFLYMGTRLFCNLTQAYVPIYLQDSLHLSEESVAYIPLVMYVSGFLTTMILKALNKFIGRKASFILGTLIGGAACIGIWLGEGDVYCKYLLYVVTAMLGAGGSIMLITSLSITADLIGPNIESGAFVYGAMSFTDKLSNGIAVMLIQNLNPCTTNPIRSLQQCLLVLQAGHHHQHLSVSNYSQWAHTVRSVAKCSHVCPMYVYTYVMCTGRTGPMSATYATSSLRV